MVSLKARENVANLKDVAKLAGVSPATASYVLNGTKRVSGEVSERVRRAVVETGYQPNRAARALRTGQSHALGLIVPDITNPFFPELARVIEARARTEGYATVLIESGYEVQTEKQGLEFLISHGVDGLIWVLSGSGRLPSTKPSVPTVLVDYAPAGWYSVHADDYGGGRMQARYALASGHKDVALLWGPLSVTSILERRRGFYDESQGVLNIVTELESPFALELPKGIERNLLAKRGVYTFLVCGNDVLAVGAIRALKRAGINVPGEVSVIGFDDTYIAEVVDPPLTTIAQPTKKLGALAVETVVRSIQNLRPQCDTLIVPVSLKERASTQPVVHLTAVKGEK
jgi:LacI family transcriptional regulator